MRALCVFGNRELNKERLLQLLQEKIQPIINALVNQIES